MMASFTDSKGRIWKPTMTVGMLKTLREDYGFDGAVMQKSMDQLGTLLFSDPERLVGIIYVMCGDQPKDQGVTPEEFGAAFDGSTLEGAGEALVEAVAGFFPRSTVAKSMVSRVKTAFAAMDKQLTESLPTTGSNDMPMS